MVLWLSLNTKNKKTPVGSQVSSVSRLGAGTHVVGVPVFDVLVERGAGQEHGCGTRQVDQDRHHLQRGQWVVAPVERPGAEDQDHDEHHLGVHLVLAPLVGTAGVQLQPTLDRTDQCEGQGQQGDGKDDALVHTLQTDGPKQSDEADLVHHRVQGATHVGHATVVHPLPDRELFLSLPAHDRFVALLEPRERAVPPVREEAQCEHADGGPVQVQLEQSDADQGQSPSSDCDPAGSRPVQSLSDDRLRTALHIVHPTSLYRIVRRFPPQWWV